VGLSGVTAGAGWLPMCGTCIGTRAVCSSGLVLTASEEGGLVT